MATINRRIAASIEGDFVVFIIGARFNRWWTLPKYLWFLSTMPKMLADVAAEPEAALGWERLNLTTNVEYLAVVRAPDRAIATRPITHTG